MDAQEKDKKIKKRRFIVSLIFGYKNIKEIGNFKQEKGQKIEKYFWEEKEVLLNMEKKSAQKHPQTLLVPPNPNVVTKNI